MDINCTEWKWEEVERTKSIKNFMHTKKEPKEGKKLIKNQVRKVVLLTEKRLCSSKVSSN